MRRLFLLPIFIFTLITLYSPVSYGASSYDIDRFTQVGGVSGLSKFEDDFDDGVEPPDGPSGASSYYLEGGATFSSNRESGGLLELSSDDFAVDPDDFWINAEVDDSTYYFRSGAGGSISGRFEANDGFTADTNFGIGLGNFDPSFTRNESPELSSGEAWVEISIDSLGNKYAVWGNDLGENFLDITADLGTNTNITMALIINKSNQLTATWDYGSDGVIDLIKDNFFTVSFLPNYSYSGSFESGANLFFSYDIDRFTQVGGTLGSTTFIDEFDDDVEPPSGPSGLSTYNVFGSFSADAESGGFLNMNSKDAIMLGDENAIGISLLDNTYYLVSGSGGFVEVKFSFPDGIKQNTFFDFDISSQPWEINNPNEAVELSIAIDTPGVISAFFVAYVDDGLNEVDIDISEIDITGLLGTTTDLTVRLDISTADVVTASIDIGSDGSFDVVMPGSYTLTFPGGKPYKGGFGPGMDLENPSPDIKANGSDGPVTPTGSLLVTVELNPGSRSGDNADWWVAASVSGTSTIDGWYYFDLNTFRFVPVGASPNDLIVTHQGTLFNLATFPVLNNIPVSGLPPGTYTFYFAVDTNRNGVLDLGELFFDSVVVNITP